MKLYDRHTTEFRLEIPGDSLAGMDLRAYDLRHLDLGGQDCGGCIFDGMDLDEIELSDANLEGASFKSASLVEAILTGVNASRAQFNRATLSMTTLAKSTLLDADFSDCIFDGVVNFTGVSALRAKFKNIKKLGAPNFWNADCREADFEGTDLSAVNPIDLTGVNLAGTCFAHLPTGERAMTPKTETSEGAEIILCKRHRDEPKLEAAVPINCIVCSQPGDPSTKKDSDYARARLCARCAVNTAICAICEEPLDD